MLLDAAWPTILAHFLIFAFVAAFVAVVILGHVLLAAAPWPNLFKFNRQPDLAERFEPRRQAPLQN